jgi:simple sugar transport system ATP-binding protein
MRQGRVVAHCDPREESARTLAQMMIGAELAARHARPSSGGEGPECLKVERLTTISDRKFGTNLRDIDVGVQRPNPRDCRHRRRRADRTHGCALGRDSGRAP